MKSQEDKERNQQDFFELRKKTQGSIKGIQEQILAAKIADAQNRKKERLHNDKVKQNIEKDYVNKNQMKKTTVKTKEELVTKKMRAHVEQKVEASKSNHTQRMLKEQQKIKKREAELARMEKMESELISKLKNTEKLQNEALKQLEEVVKSSGSFKKSPLASPEKSPEASPN